MNTNPDNLDLTPRRPLQPSLRSSGEGVKRLNPMNVANQRPLQSEVRAAGEGSDRRERVRSRGPHHRPPLQPLRSGEGAKGLHTMSAANQRPLQSVRSTRLERAAPRSTERGLRSQRRSVERRPGEVTLRALLGVLLLCLMGCSFIVHDVLGFPEKDKKSDGSRILFSHQKHLGRLTNQEKKPWEAAGDDTERSCISCHALNTDGKLYSFPAHNECRTCHAEVDGGPSQACIFCHGVPDPKPGMHEPRPGTGELIFTHATHTTGKVNQKCLDCHSRVQTSTRTEDINIPSMWDCRNCHGGANAQDGASWECKTCHQEYIEGELPPPVLKERPTMLVGHDQGFVQSHGKAAMKRNAGCDRCHEDTSCDRCHTLQPPVDHTLRFTKNLHGREATIDRGRCAACHESSFCTGCHGIGPQTHFDNGFRLEGGHAQQARRAIRSCLACHQFVGFCDTPGCHVATEARTGAPIVVQ